MRQAARCSCRPLTLRGSIGSLAPSMPRMPLSTTRCRWPVSPCFSAQGPSCLLTCFTRPTPPASTTRNCSRPRHKFTLTNQQVRAFMFVVSLFILRRVVLRSINLLSCRRCVMWANILGCFSVSGRGRGEWLCIEHVLSNHSWSRCMYVVRLSCRVCIQQR